MPKPILPKSLAADTAAGVAAARFLRAKVKEVALFVAPAMEGDIDGIHDLRVAVKRLREALRLFRGLMPRRRAARVMLLVEDLNDTLGRVRDADVMAGHAAWVVEQAPGCAVAVSSALGAWAESRARAHDELLGLWERLETCERFMRRLRRLADATEQRTRPANRQPLDSFAYAALVARSKRLEDPLAEALESREPTAVHRLRIAVKRLKYTIEPFLGVFEPIAEPYSVVSALQEALGDAHDFDVLASALQDHFRLRGLLEDDGARIALQVAHDRAAQLHELARAQTESFAAKTWYAQLMDCVD